MPVRLKKFIGAILLIILVVVYASLATAYATLHLADASGWVHLVYFLVTGFLWVVPAMLLIRWMEAKPKKG
ncbi:DUF2842 domain-containing protein [Jiella mangrovi]|uniref:DUF2842 domain-containing protein n=1 Tax=Jiella mangrovi TaxID=2821407 RepID=A0ABS4BLC6_9HYPH|nr:DUF2842 domain-containing protein [Jiella mangrovi]MBP0617519.1 DUF2842 domain-containing protein [Jiella mangrovi]